jgi:hypothetical protein
MQIKPLQACMHPAVGGCCNRQATAGVNMAPNTPHSCAHRVRCGGSIVDGKLAQSGCCWLFNHCKIQKGWAGQGRAGGGGEQ